MPNINLGITGVPEILGRNYGIEEPFLRTLFKGKPPCRVTPI